MKKTLLTLSLLAFVSLLPAQNALKDAIQTKWQYVSSHPEEHQKAMQNGWYTQAEATLKAIDAQAQNPRAINDSIPVNPLCEDAQPLCINGNNQYVLNINVGNAFSGPNYNCLQTTPNPTWFYIHTFGNLEDINLRLYAENDIDFVIWGPFPTPTCDSADLQNVVDCSYSTSNDETPTIASPTPNSYYMVMVTNFSNEAQNFYFQFLSGAIDCTPYSGYGYTNVSGYAYFDQNENCINDDADVYSNHMVRFLPGPHYAYANDTGYYSLYLPLGNYTATTTANLEDSECVNSISVTDTSISQNLDISHVFVPFCDASVFLNATNFNDSATIFVNYRNYTSIFTSGQLTLTIDTALDITGSSIPYNQVDPFTISFDLDSITLLNQTIEIYTAPLDSIDYLDYTVHLSAQITADFFDNNINNNTDNYWQALFQGEPYDPNSIEVSPFGSLSDNLISTSDTNFVYTIHFQNTGTAEAHHISVVDTIPQMLNLETIELVHSSFPCQLIFEDDRAIRFYFHNIDLIDSLHNEPESHGHVSYKIRSNATLEINDTISNFADIYFDSNAPVRTNQVNSIVPQTLGVKSVESNVRFNIYPNPANESIWLFGIAEGTTYELFDMSGRRMLEGVFNGKPISLSGISKGTYLVKVKTEKESMAKLMIKE